MNISINPLIFQNFDNPRIGITVVNDVDNTGELDLSTQFSALAKEIAAKYGDKQISEIPTIASWREAYRQFGAKPKDYPSSIESLLKRVSKGGSFWGISPLVDIYNYTSLKYLMPAGGEDTDSMTGNMQLTIAEAEEKPVTVLGKDVEEAPKVGEVIWKDEAGTICRRWNWREVARTVLTKDTKNCVLVFEALNPTTDEELKTAQQELGLMIEKYCGASVKHYILTADQDTIEI